MPIDLIHKTQNAPVPYPTILHSEQVYSDICEIVLFVNTKHHKNCITVSMLWKIGTVISASSSMAYFIYYSDSHMSQADALIRKLDDFGK